MASRFGIAFNVKTANRLDLVVAELANVSRREAKRLIESGRVTVLGRPVGVVSRSVSSGARLALISEEATLSILDLQTDFAVIDKPVALPSQPSPTSSNPSVIEVLASQFKRSGEASYETFVVHRLDTNTSGVMMVARSSVAADKLSRAISGGNSRKEYVAIVEGRIDAPMTIDQPIGRVSGNVFGVSASGKASLSEIVPIAVGETTSLIRIRIVTGRTHQIRVHLAHAGHSVVGDRKYGGAMKEASDRPLLHAAKLELEGIGSWSAEPPTDFNEAAKAFGLVPWRGAL